MNLPVAPRANNRIRFASTKESTQAMIPVQALAWLDDIVSKGNKVDGVNIAGPGDPLADLGPTLETLRLVCEKYPAMNLGITTLGLGGEQSVERLVKAGVSHVTLLVDGVDLEVVQKLYAWIRPGIKTVPLFTAVGVLLDEQIRAIVAFLQAGCAVQVRTTIYTGYNDAHAEELGMSMAALGVKSMILVPFDPATEGEEMLERPSHELMTRVRDQVTKYLTVVAIPEKIQPDRTADASGESCCSVAAALPTPSAGRPNVAVVSSNGMEVDLHLGHAITALIYGPREDGLVCLLGARTLPEPGAGASRWEILADTLKDCFVLLAASAGESPRKVLSSQGISVLITEDNIEGSVEVLYGGGRRCKK
ncbi:MAG: dinitrogenase iron-molybdenum cofactor biosynthesis protein [Deltaproteobacteria bacterium]|nr:dinitrogenase iron-molybdenum cofactor biosynthesis protein [Deltaproteobacteria bacterium]